jgi:hypothetical protein
MRTPAAPEHLRSATAEEEFTLSLPAASRQSHVPMPVILRLVREHPDRLPSSGAGSQRYFRPEAVPVLPELYEAELAATTAEPRRGLISLPVKRSPPIPHPPPAPASGRSSPPPAAPDPSPAVEYPPVTVSGRALSVRVRSTKSTNPAEAALRSEALRHALARSLRSPRSAPARSPQSKPTEAEEPTGTSLDLVQRLARLHAQQEELVPELREALRDLRRPLRGQAPRI